MTDGTIDNISIEIGASSAKAANEIKKLTESLKDLALAQSSVSKVKAKNLVPEIKEAATRSANSVTEKGLQSVSNEAKKTSIVLNKIKEAAKNASSGLKQVGDSAKKSSGGFGNLLSALKRIAMYRFLRTIIKEITQAFQEGLKNAYLFSAGITGESHRFAAAMDSMKSAGLQMKNQLGSAFISLLTAIMPVINAIINAITRLADAMSQFFAVFTGGRYLKAKDVSQQFEDTMAGGAKAAKEWKNQLLGFDVINRLEEPGNGGGGGGANALNPADMFEDAEIDGIFAKMKAKLDELKNSLNFEPLVAAWNHLKEAVKGFADVVLQYFGAAWDKILVPLAHWVIEEAAPRLVELLAKAFEFLSAVLERLKPVFDWVWEHVLKPIADFVGDAFLRFLDSVIDLLGKLTDLISGKTTFKEFLESLTPGQGILLALAVGFTVVHGAISLFNGILTTVFLAVGAFNTALTALLSPIGLVVLAIAALIAIGIALYQNWDEITAKFKQAGEELRGDWERTKEFFHQTAESIKQGFSNMKEAITAPFKEAAAELQGDIERIRTMFQNVVASVKSAFDGLRNAINNVLNGIRNTFNNVLNSILSMIQRVANAIRSLFSSIGSIGGVFNIVGMPQYASGGFPEDGLFMANHGELVGKFTNGKTAVANNQEITAGIASAVYDAFVAAFSDTSGGGSGKKTEFVFNLNGKEFARAIYSDQQAVNKEHGKSLIVA